MRRHGRIMRLWNWPSAILWLPPFLNALGRCRGAGVKRAFLGYCAAFAGR